MRFKYYPEDFCVEEIPNYTLEKGPYTLYKLTKTNIGTHEALKKVVEHFNLSWHQVSAAGLKDKQAKTIQYITIEQDIGERFEETKVLFERMGTLKHKLKFGELKENTFTTTIRDCTEKEIETIKERFNNITSLPNYFDSQRFGSNRHGKGFVGKYIIQKDFEHALKLHLATPGNKTSEKHNKACEHIAQHWGDWDACIKSIPTFMWDTTKILKFLKNNPEKYRSAVKKIEKKMRTMYLFAYQSYLFNTMLDAYIRKYHTGENNTNNSQPVTEIQYECGTLTIPHTPLPNTLLQFISKKAVFSPPFDTIAQEIITQEGFTSLEEIKMPKGLTDTFIKSTERPITFSPANKEITSTAPDDTFEGKHTITLTFTLPKGSYATILLKYLCA